MKGFTSALLLTIGLFVGLGWHGWRSAQVIKAVCDQSNQLAVVSSLLVHLHDDMAMCTQLAATSGDVQWELRYHRLKQRLEAAYQQAKRIAPSLETSRDFRQTLDARQQLAKMEAVAFSMIRGQELSAATDLLTSYGYTQQNRIYTDRVDAVVDEMERFSQAIRQHQRIQSYWAVGAAVGAVLVVVYAWWYALRLLRSHLTKRKQAEQALQESKKQLREQFAQFKLLYNTAPVGLCLLDRQLQYVRINDRMAAWNGRPADELIGSRFYEAAPQIAKHVAPVFQRVIHTGRPSLNVEFHSPTPAQPDEARHWLACCRPLKDRSGAVIGISAVVQDITEHSQAKEALQRREAILCAVADASEHFLRHASWEDYAQTTLQQIGQASQVSRVYLFENQIQQGQLITRHRFEWAAPGVLPQIDNPQLQYLPYDSGGFKRWQEMLSQGQVVCGHVKDFPGCEQAVLGPQDIASIVVVPIFAGQRWWGFIGFDECQQERQWLASELDTLKAMAGAFGAAIQREQAEAALQQAHEELERHVRERTEQLTAANAQLQQEITERRQAEQALRRNEHRYRALYENNPSMYFTVDSQATVTSVNRFGAQQLGYNVDQLVGRSVLDIVAQADRPIVSEHLAKCLSHPGQIYRWEFRKVCKDGSIIWVRETAKSVPDDSGHMVALIVCENITDRKRAEERLELQRAVLGMIAVGTDQNNVLDTLCWLVEQIMPQSTCSVLRLNEATGRLKIVAGPSLSQDMINAHGDGITPGEFMTSCGAAVHHGKAIIVEDTATDPRWTQFQEFTRRFGIQACWSVPIFSPGKKIMGTFAISHPHTARPAAFHIQLLETASHLAGIAIQRKQDEDALRESEARLRAIVNTAQDGIVTTDEHGVIESFNPAAQQMFGYLENDAIGQKLEALIPLCSANGDGGSPAVHLSEQEPGAWFGIGREATGQRKDHTRFPIEGTVGRVRLGDRYLYTNILRDITQRKQVEQDLREKNSLLKLLQAVTVAANEASNIDDAMLTALREVCAYTGWPVGHVYLPSQTIPGVLIPTKLWHLKDPDHFNTFRQITETTTFGSGEGLPGRVFASKKPAWITDVMEDPNFPRAKLAQDIGVRGGFGFPVLIGSEVGAVLEFFSTQAEQPNHDLLEVMAHVGTELGRVIERTQSMEEVIRSESRLAEAQRIAQIGSWEWDLNTNGLWWSNELTRIFGHTPGQFVPSYQQFLDQLPAQDRKFLDQTVQKTLHHGQPYVLDHRIMLPDGSTRILHTEAKLKCNPDGEPALLVGTSQDITERQHAENALRESEQRFRAIFDHAAIGIAHVDLESRFLRVNRKLCQILGYTQEQLIQRTFFDVTHPEDHGISQDCFNKLMNGETDAFTVEKRYLHKDGTPVWARVTAAAVRPSSSEPPYFVSVIEDITEHKRAQEQAQRHQAELAHVARLNTVGELASGLAHEINQPLTAISNYVQACAAQLRRGQWDNHELIDTMNKASSQCHRASEIIRRLRHFISKREPRRARVDLNHVVREAIDLVQAEARSNRVKIHTRFHSAPLLVEADHIQIEQVILNLAKNSLEAMEESQSPDRELTIMTHPLPDGAVRITLKDTGHGLPKDRPDKLFEPFYTTKTYGMGMGLSISRSIIEAHGGRMSATDNPDRGATFLFTLPATPEEIP